MLEHFRRLTRRQQVVASGTVIAVLAFGMLYVYLGIDEFRYGRKRCDAIGGTWYQWNGNATCFFKGVKVPQE